MKFAPREHVDFLGRQLITTEKRAEGLLSKVRWGTESQPCHTLVDEVISPFTFRKSWKVHTVTPQCSCEAQLNMWMCLAPCTVYFKCKMNAGFFPLFKTENGLWEIKVLCSTVKEGHLPWYFYPTSWFPLREKSKIINYPCCSQCLSHISSYPHSNEAPGPRKNILDEVSNGLSTSLYGHFPDDLNKSCGLRSYQLGPDDPRMFLSSLALSLNFSFW